jgi:hypothetical protein
MQLELPLTACVAELRPPDAEPRPSHTVDRDPVALPPPAATIQQLLRGPSSPEPRDLLRAREPEFVRHPKARRYIIRVRRDGTVRVTIPRGGSKREAEDFARRQAGWVEAQRARLVTERPEAEPSDLDRNVLARAKNELPARLLELAARHGLSVSRVSIRNQRWRWGSCSRSGHICLNWRLVQMPPPVRDYVMIHELMHLRRMDHSPRFWKLVAAACPDYKTARDWLRHHARA